VGGKRNAFRYRAKPVAWLVGDFRQIDPRFEPDSSLRKFNIGQSWDQLGIQDVDLEKFDT
jgi:hypothetical protein